VPVKNHARPLESQVLWIFIDGYNIPTSLSISQARLTQLMQKTPHLPTDVLLFIGLTGFPVLPQHSPCCSRHRLPARQHREHHVPVALPRARPPARPGCSALPGVPSRGPFPGAGRCRAAGWLGERRARPAPGKLMERSSSFSTAGYCWHPPPGYLGGPRSERWREEK